MQATWLLQQLSSAESWPQLGEFGLEVEREVERRQEASKSSKRRSSR